MEMDWDHYRTCCAEQRVAVLERFGRTLQKGADIATVQSALVYTGQLTASLVTILRQMTDTLKLCELSAGGLSDGLHGSPADRRIRGMAPAGMADAEVPGRVSGGRNHFRQAMNRCYFSRISGIEELEIAQEYVRTHFQYQMPRREEMTAWLLSYQGRAEAVQELVRKIDRETDSFIREDMPRIVKESPAELTVPGRHAIDERMNVPAGTYRVRS